MTGYLIFAVYTLLILAAARWAMRGFPLPRHRAVYDVLACAAAYVAFEFLRPWKAH